MILEEILSAVLSFASFFTRGHPRFNQHDADIENVRFIDACQVDQYEQGSCQELDNPVMLRSNIQQSVDSNNHEPTDFSWSHSLRGVSTSFTMILAIIPLGILIATTLYLDLNTTNLCFERMRRDSLPRHIIKWRLIGNVCETIAIYLWFPFTLGVLFGWKGFKMDYLFTVYISLTFGCLVVIFKIILFIYYIFQTTKYHTFFGNVIFFLDFLICSYLVARKLCRNTALSKLQISIILSMEFITGSFIGLVYMYGIVPGFNGLKNDITKAIVAFTAPICAVIPKTVCMALALKISKKADSVDPGRSFVLVYYLHGVTTLVYRTMQADVKNMWIFIGMSIQHGILHVAQKATKKYIDKIWTFLINMLCRLFGGQREVHRSSNDKTHEQRLDADLDIQNMLCEYTALILTQIYFAFYLITNFEVSSWPILRSALLRIAIAVSIDFVFNCLAIFIQTYWYDIPVGKVWFKHWRLHMLAQCFPCRNGDMVLQSSNLAGCSNSYKQSANTKHDELFSTIPKSEKYFPYLKIGNKK